MRNVTRRSFMEMAIALGATGAWARPTATRSNSSWHERRDLYPEGVASGDPESDSVLLWTGRPPKAKPFRILQGIASGLLGSKAFDGGLPSALLGLCLHFFIAFGAACVYVLLARWGNFLVQYVYFSGPLYGVAVYFFMQMIVVPLSGARKGPFSFKMMLIGIVIHIFCVGLPISLVTRRYVST